MDHDKRVCVYPCYLNANCTASMGRKIAKSAACDNPTTPEIYDCIVNGLKLPADVERKTHPKDWKYLGRVRVQLKDDSGKLLNPEVPSRQALMVKVAELVPRHPGRTGKAKTGGAAGSSSGAGPSSSGGVKKSGKKKK